MGAAVGVQQEPYDYSSTCDSDDTNSMQRSIFGWKLRRRSVSASSDNTINRPEPVRINYLDVPYLDRHPFQDFRFGKKLGE
jgi:hypothetical protein